MLVYFITRFSIFDYNFKGYNITNKLNIEEYESYLFSEDRLNYKFMCFQKITLPSIIKQKNQNYIWEIYTSDKLPTKFKNKLIEITKKYDKIKLFFIESFKEFNNSEKIEDKYCTVRLDDDDALNINFVSTLMKYKDRNNLVISFPMGRKCSIQQNSILYGEQTNLKKTAQGLCSIGKNIYKLGNHNKIDLENDIVYDETPNMYLINCSEFCDTKRKFR